MENSSNLLGRFADLFMGQVDNEGLKERGEYVSFISIGRWFKKYWLSLPDIRVDIYWIEWI